MKNSHIKLLLTGGACAGKTTSIKFIKEYLYNFGYKVYIVNEIPTALIKTGIIPQKVGNINFLNLVIKIQLEMYKIYNEITSNKVKTIIIFDGSPIDVTKFVNKKQFERMIEQYKLNYNKILNMYDVVIHLETVASSFPELYSKSSNKARISEIDMAIENDIKIQNAYKIHKNRILIKSTKDFDIKKERIIFAINSLLNL